MSENAMEIDQIAQVQEQGGVQTNKPRFEVKKVGRLYCISINWF